MASPPLPRKFNQTSRITARLRDLVRSYPKGLGVVKEFLQNADDAGASYLHVTYDRRQHPGHLNTTEQDVVLGPALLLANDSTFTEKDREDIQHIDDGGKLREARGTGRFGQGVNTFYSVSDHPTLLTGDSVIWFDPHQRAHGSDRNAWEWSLEDVTIVWPAWAATFEPAGLVLGSARFEGTVFRLPVRSVKDAFRSEILPEAFTDQDFEAILDEVRRAGPALLVFLRSVLSLRIDEIAHDGTRQTRYEIATTNPIEVEDARAPLREAVRGDTRELLARWLNSSCSLPSASYTHAFQVLDDGERTGSSWAVVTGLFRGPDNDLLKHAHNICLHNEKAIPWAGAAAPIDADVKVSGMACFLPLPEPTPWPVLLHGWFDVDSARRGITRQAGTGESSQIRTLWNQKLLRHGGGLAWAALVEQIRRDADVTTDPYRLWPRPSDAKDEHDRALVDSFYAEIGKRPVFRCVEAAGVVWRSLEGMGKKYWSVDDAWHNELRDLLLANGNTLVEPPLPVSVVQALQKCAHPAAVLSADAVRGALQQLTVGSDINCALSEAPWMALRRTEWVVSLARFCAQGRQDRLAGLPLALLADGKLHTFGQCGTVYLVTDAERLLLADVAHRTLCPKFQAELELTNSVLALGVKRLDMAGLVACVQEILAAGAPDEAWLVRLFEHLEQYPPAEVKAHKHALQTLDLVPDQAGRRRSMGFIQTPLLLNSVSHPLRHALTKLGVPMVSGSGALMASIRRFASRHEGFVWTLTPGDLIDALELHAREPWLHQEAFSDRAALNPILDFLSPPDWVGKNDPRVAVLRQLPWLPTTDGSIVSAETEDLYVPGGFDPPYGVVVRHRLLDIGKEGLWAALFRALRVPEWDGFTFVVRGLLPAFHESSEEVQLRMLRWLRDQLRVMDASLALERRNNLLSEVRKAAILPLVGGGMGAPCHTYYPSAEEAREVLGEVAKVPDLERLGDDPKRWSGFFADLDLLWTPRADHLLEAVQQCVAEAGLHGVASVRERLKALREHIVRRWDSLGNPKEGGSQQFADALSGLAWLPAEKPAPEKVAAPAAWPDRLYKASELAAPRFLHLVASVRPVLEGAALPDDMAKMLGLRTQVPFDEILKHFAAVRAIDRTAAGDEVQKACRKAFVAFVQFIADLPDKEAAIWMHWLASLQQTPCVLMRGAWWRVHRVFLESLPFETDWCVSLLDDQELAGRPRIVEGLIRLGVRTRPESSDWVEMLTEQRDRAMGRPLSNHELAQVHAALQQLRVENREWLQAHPICVPTVKCQLLLARDTLLPDDPRLKRLACLCPLPLVEEVEVSLEIATSAGARSLHKVLVEELADEPIPSQDASLLAWAEQRTGRVRSDEFYEALRRLAWHEAVEQGTSDPSAAANDERLTLPRRLTLRVARALKVTSEVCDTGEVVFEQRASSFWDQESSILWLSQGGKRKMNDDLARTLATECKLDALRLSRLLDAEPGEMADLLDEDSIVMIPAGVQGSLPPIWIAPDHPSDVRDQTATDLEEPEVADAEDEEPWASEEPVDDAPERAMQRPWPNGPRAGDGHERRPRPDSLAPDRGGDGAAQRPNHGPWNSGALPSDDPSSTGATSEAPTKPGFGSSQPWSPDAPRPAQGRARRLRSYVHPTGQSDYDTNSTGIDWAQIIGREAVQRVIDWERAQGRIAVEVADNHRGYDLDSSGSEGLRHIEVKAIDGHWTARGVAVTSPEFLKAVEVGPSWWLYIVEHARDPARAVVHALRNPFLEAAEYRFDSGWRAVTAAEAAQPEGPVEGEEVVLNDGRVATVVEAERRGQLWQVTLKVSGGQEEVLPWDFAWRRG